MRIMIAALPLDVRKVFTFRFIRDLFGVSAPVFPDPCMFVAEISGAHQIVLASRKVRDLPQIGRQSREPISSE